MKKLITLIGIVSAIVFLNPAQAKADVRAYVYFNPLSWFFTPPVRVIEKRTVYHRPTPKKVVYVQPAKYKRGKYRHFKNRGTNKYSYTKYRRGDKYRYSKSRMSNRHIKKGFKSKKYKNRRHY